ncbi:ABC transporter permease [Metabacillus iocasae]|uniref:ABC transport system permease protein n=1 Tax=Priestia iocasae TaxID=2291674 RepID=A0ABS2QTN1_9BACI|nr:ABC transporter permease [Metabacillus iocasae]MBM7702653.1 putative ABC transport system permease protein [Metabacillus iocasae]
MSTAIFGSFEAGLIYAIMALGVYISFRILNIPDLTVDGSFVTGAAIAAVSIVNGVHPVLASVFALIGGFITGCMTGLLHTKGKINALLSGILMMIALYSINLRIMGKSNVPLLQEETMFTSIVNLFGSIDEGINSLLAGMGLNDWLPKTWAILFLMIVLIAILKVLLDQFLKTEIGLALRATGDNVAMIRSFAGKTDTYIIVGLGLSNALVAFSGGLIAQYSGFSDIGMGIGMIVIGLASVIIGEAIVGSKTIVRATLAVILGAIIYRLIVTLALRVEFLETGDLKLITAAIVIMALLLPKAIQQYKEGQRKKARRAERMLTERQGETIAATKTNS